MLPVIAERGRPSIVRLCAGRRRRPPANESSGTEVTHYVGGLLEKVASAGVTKWRHYVPTPSGHMVLVSRNSNATGAITFVVTDHLGSSDTLLNQTGAIKAKLSFDAFGARRGSDWTTTTAPDWTNIASTTRRGFTFHTQLDAVSLVHMNGRVFDPKLGQFLSVDPIIGDLGDSQSVNPYAYVGNRPLSFTDPSGFLADGGCGFWCASAIASVAKFFSGLFGCSAPPPPATALPGQSALNGTALCGPGSSSASCNGVILYVGTDASEAQVVGSATPTTAATVAVLAGRMASRNPQAAAATVAGGAIAMSVVFVLVSSSSWEQIRRPSERWEYIPPVQNSADEAGGSGTDDSPVSPVDNTSSPAPPEPDDDQSKNRGDQIGATTIQKNLEIGPKIERQMVARGWTPETIAEARAIGQQIRAVNKANGNPATRYVHPRTGQSVVIDDVTGEVIHVGGPGFRYGPGSGDVP